MNNNEVLFFAGFSVLVALIGYGLYLVRQFVLSKLDVHDEEILKSQLQVTQHWVVVAVNAVEQLSKMMNWSSEEKKERAVLMVNQYLASYGIEIDVEELDSMIEAAVNMLNSNYVDFVNELGKE